MNDIPRPIVCITILAVAALSLAACTTAPDYEPRQQRDDIEQLQERAWAEPYELMPFGDWTPMPAGDCQNRAMWLIQELRARGHDPAAMVGYHNRDPETLHMVIVVEARVIDFDGVHSLAGYLEQWRSGPAWYDWRVAQAAWQETQQMPRHPVR